ncbi:MAG: glycosyltransferase [Flavobacteriales bacterium]
MKNILFLSYWSLREPLTAAAIFPYLRILSEREDVQKIILFTLETTTAFLPPVKLDIPKVTHMALNLRFTKWPMISKADLVLRAIHQLTQLMRTSTIDLLIAKASMAGAIAHIVSRRTGHPYIVESFEPHSQYMLNCGVWSRYDPRYLFSRFFEARQLRSAENLITVTWNQARDLERTGLARNPIHVIPSITDIRAFRFNSSDRQRIREQHGIPPNATVGIYVGKFGGLYYDEKAFRIFLRAHDHFKDLHIVVLSPSDLNKVRAKALHAGIDMTRFHTLVAPHIEVPAYLSAADFAFSTVKPTIVSLYQCPVKNGEYWASGLPFIMADRIADDHRLMRRGIGGAVFQNDLSGLDQAFDTIKKIMARSDYREQITKLAKRYKSLDIVREVYSKVIGEVSHTSS